MIFWHNLLNFNWDYRVRSQFELYLSYLTSIWICGINLLESFSLTQDKRSLDHIEFLRIVSEPMLFKDFISYFLPIDCWKGEIPVPSNFIVLHNKSMLRTHWWYCIYKLMMLLYTIRKADKFLMWLLKEWDYSIEGDLLKCEHVL